MQLIINKIPDNDWNEDKTMATLIMNGVQFTTSGWENPFGNQLVNKQKKKKNNKNPTKKKHQNCTVAGKSHTA